MLESHVSRNSVIKERFACVDIAFKRLTIFPSFIKTSTFSKFCVDTSLLLSSCWRMDVFRLCHSVNIWLQQDFLSGVQSHWYLYVLLFYNVELLVQKTCNSHLWPKSIFCFSQFSIIAFITHLACKCFLQQHISKSFVVASLT